jgi:hypothetical protein
MNGSSARTNGRNRAMNGPSTAMRDANCRLLAIQTRSPIDGDRSLFADRSFAPTLLQGRLERS